MALLKSRFAAACLLALLAWPIRGQQPVDQDYTARITQHTTAAYFLTELVDHLPAGGPVPTPAAALGYIAGETGKLTYTKDIHRYMRELARASERVAVFPMGVSEEGRETILVAISDAANMARLDHFKAVTARLANPRSLVEAEAARLIEEGLPVYWATGAIHSPETGSPEMLMELAYRLAVTETPFFDTIRRNAIVLITPVVEVDGRDRQVDIVRYQQANPGKPAPPLVYWGKYVAHDNNRDGLTLSLALSRMVMKTFLDWHPQVLHDLHESIPFLYTSTGTGPYNAWLDPIVINEWQKLAYHEVEEMTKRGVPGIWTHGFYDGWGANYMVIAAQGHNSIGRFYETFGNVVPETMDRDVAEGFSTRAWFRPNPPLPKVQWSLRNNVNLQQSALLLAINYVARHRQEFLRNFYLKGQRSVKKATTEGPAAWVIPADDPRPLACAEAVNLLRLQGVETHRLAEPWGKEPAFPAGSYVIRMDQPYSRMADMMLDRQYYSPEDPRSYDDTGWSLGPLRNIRTVRVTDTAILDAPMALIEGPVEPRGGIEGPADARAYLLDHNAENALATFRFRLRDIGMLAAEKPFEADGRKYAAGAFVIPAEGNPADLPQRLAAAAEPLGLRLQAVAGPPDVPTHPVAAPRLALVHTWWSTQTEGWVRVALDSLEIPYDYVSDHVIRDTASLRDKYDVILYGPTGGSAQDLVNGIPKFGDPVPWRVSDLTPNIGTAPDQTDDIRGGLELEGLMHLREFVRDGGVLITFGQNAALPIDFGLVEGVTIEETKQLQARGSVIRTAIADAASPLVYGLPEGLAVHFNQAPGFQVSRTGGVARRIPAKPPGRPSGRGAKDEPDVPQGRPYVEPAPPPKGKPGEELPLSEYERRRYAAYLPPPEAQPRVVLRFAPEKELLVAGLLTGGSELAERSAVVDVPVGKGHVVMFANNPMWRSQTQGSYFLVLNALLHCEHLNAGWPSPEVEETGQ